MADWHIEIPDADSTFLQRNDLLRIVGVANTASASEHVGYATLEGGQNPYKPYLFISGWNKEALDTRAHQTWFLADYRKTADEVVDTVSCCLKRRCEIFQRVIPLPSAVGNRMERKSEAKLRQRYPYTLPEKERLVLSNRENLFTVVGICATAGNRGILRHPDTL